MPVYHTPGVYFEQIDSGREKIASVRTDIPGFVGVAERGPLDNPIRLESWKQFQSVFGGFISHGYLAYAVNGFFDNGGDTCYVVRIADVDSATKATKAETTLLDKNGNLTIKVSAINEGKWGNQIRVSLKEAGRGSTITAEPSKQPADKKYSIVQGIMGFETGILVKVFQNKSGTLVEDYHYVKSVDLLSKKVVWDNQLKGDFDLSLPIYFSAMEFTLTFSLGAQIKEVFKNLSINPGHKRYFAKEEKVINGQSNLVIVEDMGSPSSIPDNLPDPKNIKKGFQYLNGGVDGVHSIEIGDIIGDPITEKKRGLRCYEDVDEVGMISIPDIMIPQVKISPSYKKSTPEESDPCSPKEKGPEGAVSPPYELSKTFTKGDIHSAQQKMIEHCENMKDRMAILDPPFGADLPEIQEWRQWFDSKYATLYYPWIRVDDPLKLDNQITRLIPPSGHIAGIYARSDLTRGVHKAPANENIRGAKDVDVMIEGSEQDILNPMGINILRVFPAGGVMVWGARTISSDTSWRYVNVRRLFIMIEESVEKATQWAVFEPNDFHLRTGMRIAISSFLEELWRKGALAGAVPEEAFFVKCDEDNNPPDVVDAGKIITEIGVAPSIPGEFIVFRIGRVENQMEIIEEL